MIFQVIVKILWCVMIFRAVNWSHRLSTKLSCSVILCNLLCLLICLPTIVAQFVVKYSSYTVATKIASSCNCVIGVFQCELCYIVSVKCKIICIVFHWPSLATLRVYFPPRSLHKLTSLCWCAVAYYATHHFSFHIHPTTHVYGLPIYAVVMHLELSFTCIYHASYACCIYISLQLQKRSCHHATQFTSFLPCTYSSTGSFPRAFSLTTTYNTFHNHTCLPLFHFSLSSSKLSAIVTKSSA